MAQARRQPLVMPLEMRHQDLAVVQAARPAACRPSVRLRAAAAGVLGPLSSPARHYNPPKDDCRFSCMEHPDGLPMRTREERFSGAQRHANAVGPRLQPD